MTASPGAADAAEEARRGFEDEALVHLDALYGLALRLTGGDEARAGDLVQEAVLRAFRSWDRFEPGTNSRAWLMTILRNTFINEWRRRKSRPVELGYEEGEERVAPGELFEADPEGRLFDRIVDREVVRAIEELPDVFRLPVVLSDLEGLSYQEISELLRIPVGTVKSRLFRARRRLQRRLHAYAREMGYIR